MPQSAVLSLFCLPEITSMSTKTAERCRREARSETERFMFVLTIPNLPPTKSCGMRSDTIRNGEVDPDAVRERLRDILTPEQEDILVGMYLEAYAETGKTADEVWEEIVCDSLGDLNIFNGEPLEAAADILIKNTRIATEENIEERRTRGWRCFRIWQR